MEEPTTPNFETLSFEEARVLGCLVEKESTTPDYYPMTLNALTTACNQTTSRDPVVSFDERTVQVAVEGLKSKQLVFQVSQAGARAVKFKHNVPGRFPHLDEAMTALLCTLVLRGPQTVGELRQRSERMVPFPDIPAVEAELTKLMEYPGGALITCFAPGGGRKSATYAHLLCGEVAAPHAVLAVSSGAEVIDPGWKEKMEAEIAALKEAVAALKAQLGGA
ncbi:MAG: YceH family protein [Verrucomicrobiaceae bacterium]|nr:YceH family protein [Verrucomicrobiaceae bacterium]